MATLSSKVSPSGVATAAQGGLADSAVQPNDSPTFAGLTVDTDTLYVDATGNKVGIGTSLPSELLHLAADAPRVWVDASSSGEPTFNGDSLNGGVVLTAQGMNLTSKYTPALMFGSTDSELTTNTPRIGAAIVAEAAQTFSADTTGAMHLSFWTRDGTLTTAQNAEERMRIASSGNVGIGVTSTPQNASTSTAGFWFDAANGYMVTASAGDVALLLNRTVSTGAITQFRYNGSIVGTISVTGSSTAYNTSSDYRLKTDAQPMAGAVARVQALKPVNFAWITDGTRVDGFLAHEAQEVVPEAVTGTKDAIRDEEYEVTPAVLDEEGNVVTEAVMGTRSAPDYQGIDQSKLVPLLTAALQEALAKIDALETRITALEGA